MPKGQYERPQGRPVEERYWEQVAIEDGCWSWLGLKNPEGYGYLTFKRRREGIHKNIYAHRTSWEINRGTIPDGLWVLHHCDNPECTNPDHLFLGTNQDNIKDMVAKGRARVPTKLHLGEENGESKLTAERVLSIRASAKSGVELAVEFGVSKSCISSVRRRATWKHIP